jgi:Superinfection immunity protein
VTVVTPGNAALLIVGGLIVYLLPSIIALVRRRRVSSVGRVVIINVLLGWTLVGWVIALAMAFRVSQPIGAR